MDELVRIVLRLQGGDSSAFEDLYNKTSKIALAVIRKYDSRGKLEQEDLLQETYIEVYNHIGDLKEPEKVQAWINMIAGRKAGKALKKDNPMLFSELESENEDGDENTLDIADESPEFNPEAVADKKAVANIVNEILEELPEDQKMALWMVYGQEMKIKEIADELGVSENTIKSRLFQGRKKLEARKEDFRKRGIELALIPFAVLIHMAFQHDTAYAAEALAGTGAVTAAKIMGAAKTTGAGAASSAGGSATTAGTAANVSVGSSASQVAEATGKAAAAGASKAIGLKAGIAVLAVAAAGGGFALTSHKTSVLEETTAVETIVEETTAAPETFAEVEDTVPELSTDEKAVLSELMQFIGSGNSDDEVEAIEGYITAHEDILHTIYEKTEQEYVFDGDALVKNYSGDGVGVTYFEDCAGVYLGSFAEGEPDGEGVSVRQIKEKYRDTAYARGTWKNGKLNGYAVTGKILKEEFKDSLQRSHTRDEGEFIDDVINGTLNVYTYNPSRNQNLRFAFTVADGYAVLEDGWHEYHGATVHDVTEILSGKSRKLALNKGRAYVNHSPWYALPQEESSEEE